MINHPPERFFFFFYPDFYRSNSNALSYTLQQDVLRVTSLLALYLIINIWLRTTFSGLGLPVCPQLQARVPNVQLLSMVTTS